MFSGLVRRQVDGRLPCVDYLVAHKELLERLVKGCEFLFENIHLCLYLQL